MIDLTNEEHIIVHQEIVEKLYKLEMRVIQLEKLNIHKLMQVSDEDVIARMEATGSPSFEETKMEMIDEWVRSMEQGQK